MESITMCQGAPSGLAPIIFFRLEDGEQTFYHSTGITARLEDAERNLQLRNELEHHKLAMCKAYTLMLLKRMDMNIRIFEMMVSRVMTESVGFTRPKHAVPVYNRLMQYLEEAYRDGLIGLKRYTVLMGKARKLQRFLIIKGLSGISSREFTTDLLLEYRKFIYDEYLYVSQFPELYTKGGGKHAPRRRCKVTVR